jgi:hypothetical protein
MPGADAERPSNAEALMSLPDDHAALLKRHDYEIPADLALDDAERALLSKYGRWMEALAAGRIRPLTAEQEQFVRAAHGDEPPRTDFERVWAKCVRARAAAPAPVGPMEVSARLAALAQARRHAASVRAEKEGRRAAVLEQVRAQLEQIDEAYADELRAAEDAVGLHEAEARQAVLQAGQSVKQDGVHAVYVRGRVTWDGKGLSEYAEAHPDVQQFRRVSPPSVSLRYENKDGPSSDS